MSATPRQALIRAARNWCAERHVEPTRIVIIARDGERLSLPAGESEAGPAPRGVREFSDLEERILAAMPEREYIASAELADKLGQLSSGGSVSSHFRAVLTNLVDRGAIQSDRAGYRKFAGAAS